MFKKILLFLVILAAASVVIFELLSRRPCAAINNIDNPCSSLLYEYVLKPSGSIAFTTQEKKQVTYKQIKDPEFEKKMQAETYYVPMSELRANGIACLGYAFVANELPERAKRYVTFHENIHLAGERNETRTNYLAAMAEPIGFIQTIIYSVYRGIRQVSKDNFFCSLGMLWNAFKIYFLKPEL